MDLTCSPSAHRHCSELQPPRAAAAAICCAIVAALVSFPVGAAAPRQSSLEDVVARAGEYVKAYAEQLSALVGREEYDQEFSERTSPSATGLYSGGRTPRKVSLVSEFALVKADGSAVGWEGFRDVFEVNGKPLGDRKDRLERLIRETPAAALTQARAIADESARFNIGTVARNFNVPTAVLFFLHPSNQHRFSFTKTSEARLNEQLAWVIAFEERLRPTVIRTTNNKDVPTKGSVWVEPASGRVLRTVLEVENFARDADESLARLTVDYGSDPNLGIWVPAAMTEYYRTLRRARATTSRTEDSMGTLSGGREPGGATVYQTRGFARYSNFRRFATKARLVVPK